MHQISDYQKKDARTATFRLKNSHVTYANTLRRIILTGVETIAFRSDMTSTGTTTDVTVQRNDTPMTNEMLADRIGLLPIDVKEPLSWKEDAYRFKLSVLGNKDSIRHVKSEDFTVIEWNPNAEEEKQEERLVSTDLFFPRNPITNDTCLIATLQPGEGSMQQGIELVAKATKGTGREHARFCPVSQCTYEYTLDTDETRIQEMFMKWLTVSKKVSQIDKASDRYQELWSEFHTMQRKRCFKVNEKGEPYEFDFTVESVGVLSVEYIVQRACEVAKTMCDRYAILDKGDLPDEISVSPADSRIIGFDFLFRGHDHTLGNLFQTWMVQNLIEGTQEPRIQYAGYAVPHPLRDQMVLRVGVTSGEESVARAAIAAAAKGCSHIFDTLRNEWRAAMQPLRASRVAPRRPRTAEQKQDA